ncbi:hypothetical protein DPQ33_10420 [Oceanidesulfovibrio indonesiensis]|uniref:Periplasmic heavy metal sensor n=1 Tax=Oceanidesulfovibrio indonesiensis TaxID=54767 RepID=A0A7M3MEG0_9BACT|nr:Spy/CpxP family protein refolding chaperone [Oceanidesulfovibrio indonesiensis]TVM17194.1 hypothetical protein DPQ33_10420 [Oceanidesulfovibrio indonesiensis]
MKIRSRGAQCVWAVALVAIFSLAWMTPCEAQQQMAQDRGKPGMMHGAHDGPPSGTMDMLEDKRRGARGMDGMSGMQDMMMSHMMGGRGGMGKMMGRMGADMPCPRMGPHGFQHMGRMLEDLNLTPGQWEQVRALAREKLDSMADMWAQRMKLRIDMLGMRWEDDVDPQQVRDLFVKQAEIKADMLLASMDYMKRLKGLLNEEQLQKLEAQGF